MRICVLSAGAFTHVGAYLDFFRGAGHDVHLIALSKSPPRSVPVHEAGSGEPDRDKWRYAPAILRARALVRRLKPDVVHAHYATSGGLAALACGHGRVVVTAHGTDLREGVRSPVWRPLLKAVLRRAACVNTVSAELTGLALGLGVDPARVAELTPGIDTALFRADDRCAPRADRPLRLISTRRHEAVYDPGTIVDALAILRMQGIAFKMTFAGEGPLRGALESQVRRRGLGGAVAFAGTVGGGEMPGLLRAHDAYLSASRADGTSLSLLEAMAAGLFPIVSRIPANAAWLENGVGAFLHRVGDPDDLAARVAELARRPRLAAYAADFNRARVVRAGDRATNMRRLEEIYRELLAHPVDSAR